MRIAWFCTLALGYQHIAVLIKLQAKGSLLLSPRVSRNICITYELFSSLLSSVFRLKQSFYSLGMSISPLTNLTMALLVSRKRVIGLRTLVSSCISQIFQNHSGWSLSTNAFVLNKLSWFSPLLSMSPRSLLPNKPI